MNTILVFSLMTVVEGGIPQHTTEAVQFPTQEACVATLSDSLVNYLLDGYEGVRDGDSGGSLYKFVDTTDEVSLSTVSADCVELKVAE